MSRQNEYRKRHLSERAAYMREWRKKQKAHYLEWTKSNRAKNPERYLAANRKWRASEKGKAWRRKWAAENPDLIRASNNRAEIRRKIRKMTNAEYYAQRRASQRLVKAMASMRKGIGYRPIFSRRIPNHVCMGENILDYGSMFLIDNRTAEQRAYARELYRERNPK